MKVKKLLAKAEAIFDSEQRERKEQKKHVKKVLQKLRNYEERLTEKLKRETDPATIEKLSRKISLVHTQRKKGLSLMQELTDNQRGEGEK